MDDEDLYGDLPHFDYKANLEKYVIFSKVLTDSCYAQLKETIKKSFIKKYPGITESANLQESNKELKEQVFELTEQIKKLTSENEVLTTKCNRLLKNVSSVIKTGRCEIKRKDLRIAELNREISIIKTRVRIPRSVIQEVIDSKSGKNEPIRQERRRSRGRSEERKEYSSPIRKHNDRWETRRRDAQKRRNGRSPKKKVDEKESFQSEVKMHSSFNQTINETTEESPPPSAPGNNSVTVIPNITAKNTNQNDCANETNRQVPNISLPTLYSQRMFRKIYNLDSPKTENYNPIESRTSDSPFTDETDTAVFVSAVTENLPISTKPAVQEDLRISTEPSIKEDLPSPTESTVKEDLPILTESTVKNDLPITAELDAATTTVSTCSVAPAFVPPVNSLITIEQGQSKTNNNIVLTSESNYSVDLKPKSDLILPINSIIQTTNIADNSSTPCIDKINNEGNDESVDTPKEVTIAVESDQTLKYPEETKRSMSLEEELHLSSDSRLDGTSTNIVDIHLNIQSNILNRNSERDLQVEELKNILSNLNKLNDSKKCEKFNSTKEDEARCEQNLLNSLDNAIPKKSEVPAMNAPPLQSEDYKNSNKFCSTSLGLRLMNRQTKTLVKPISTQWSETYKKNFDKDCLLKNKNENVLTVPKTPPRSEDKEDKENDNQDIVEVLFGSPLKWTENSVDEVPSKLCPPPSAFEDSCSAQIENAKFKKLNNTESVSSTKTVKEIIVSKNDKDVSTMTIESRISVQKIKEVPRRPFEQLNNEKKGKSNFSAYLENTEPTDTNSSITLTTLSGSVKSLRKSPICSKYHDSILGAFDDTTQLISALAQEHSKVSPITTPVKENRSKTPENKTETKVPVSVPTQIPKMSSPLSSFKKKVFTTPSQAKISEKKTIFLEEPINILCPRRKSREDAKKKVIPRNASKNEKECDKNKEQSNENQATSSPTIPVQQRNTKPSSPKELNVEEKLVASSQEVGNSLVNVNSPRITIDKFNLNSKVSTAPSDKHETSFSRRQHESQRESRRPSCENIESCRPLSEKSKRPFSSEKNDDRGLKRRLPSGEKIDNESKRHSSSEKYDTGPKRHSSEKYYNESRRSSSEKYDADSRKRKSHSYYTEGNSRSFYERYEDRDSRIRNSHDRGSNSSRRSSSDRHDDRYRDKGESEYSPFRRHDNYRHYYDENGRKKVSFTTISTKVSSNVKQSFSPKKPNPPKEVIGQDKSVTPPKTTFKRPLSYERIRRSNCLFRETSVERRIWRNVRHRIRRTPVNIIKRRDVDQRLDKTKISQEPKGNATPSPNQNVRIPQISSPDNGSPKPPVRIVRASKKIDWSASPIQVVSTHPAEDPNRPKTESLMQWVLQPIDFANKNIQAQRGNDSKNTDDRTDSSTVVSVTPNKTSENETTPKQIPTAVRISRNRPVKFGVSEISTQICKTTKEA